MGKEAERGGQMRQMHPPETKRPGGLVRAVLEVRFLGKSAFGRRWVVAIAVAIANATVFAMDQNLAFLVDRDLARGALCLSLRVVQRGVTGIAFTTDGPLVVTANYVLVFSSHLWSFKSKRLKLRG